MIKFKRYYTAIPRYKRSKGFGIHSPFAFNFVLRVLRERCPYYAYEIINASRWEASRLASSAKERRNLLSFKNAKMIFRITCYFSPKSILQIGTSHGIASTAMMNVSSTSHLYSYLGVRHQRKIYDSITSSISNRISTYDDVTATINNYSSQLTHNEIPFMIINHIDSENGLIIDTATDIVNKGGVVIVSNINNNSTINQSWQSIKSSMTHGMSFSNDKIGVIVGYNHLPLQHFSLWF
ncbi:MAG: hypothetical protein IKV32_03420 [Muribaculaceae bacterium]|nr:hypothetical protein [Muribaculaceae bacterium]